MKSNEVQYPVMESFFTIQGEGMHTGSAAYFIRLGGCDVGCVWCDVKESWNAAEHPFQSVEELFDGVQEANCPLVVITGGEPLMYDMAPLTRKIKDAGIQTNIETSGAYPMSGEWDWVCFSPKKFKKPHHSIYAAADELKVIVFNVSDFKFAEEHALKVSDHCKLLLQPEWEKQDEMLPLIINYVKTNPQWRISLQTHKYMGVD